MPDRPRVLAIGPAPPELLAILGSRFQVHVAHELDDPIAWLDANGAGLSYVATNGHDGLPLAWMERMPDLKLISCFGVGYDAIDVNAAAARGIMVTHTPDVLNEDVADTAILLMLACYRNFILEEAHARSGLWETNGNAPLSRSAENQKVGLLGMGRIGQVIARKLGAFNAKISYHSRSPKDVPYTYVGNLTELAKKVDCLICITPGGPATQNLVNQEVLEALGPKGTLINVSRGSVVDEDALVRALQSGKLGWAGLDVFAQEPKIPDALKDMPNVCLLPHVGSGTVETRQAMGRLMIGNLFQHLDDGTVVTPVPECAGLA